MVISPCSGGSLPCVHLGHLYYNIHREILGSHGLKNMERREASPLEKTHHITDVVGESAVL